MQLNFHGITGTGIDLLDTGIGDFTILQNDAGTFLYTTTGKSGGIVGYRIEADGSLAVHSSVIFPDNMTFAVEDRLILTDDGSGPMLAVGTNARGVMGFSIGADGQINSRGNINWDDAAELATDVGNGILEAWLTMDRRPLEAFPVNYPDSQIVSLRYMDIGEAQLVLSLCVNENRIGTFMRDGDSGQLSALSSLGAAEGLGINAPTALELVTLGDACFVIVAAAGSSSLTVMQLDVDGSLRATDHVIDTGATRFASVQAMTTVTVGDHAFVIAGGGDHGLTLFTLLPDGTLLALDTVADSAATGLHNVSALSAVVVGDALHIFAGSQRDPGTNHFTLSLEQLGERIVGSAGRAEVVTGTSGDDVLIAMADGDTLVGGAGNDILVAGPGATTMQGGSGANIYVMRDDSGPVHVQGFQAGIDRVDLSDWPMLRNEGQISFVTTANGARIEYRDHVVHITSADGLPLTINDVLGQGFHWPDRIPVLIQSETLEPGQMIIGTDGDDELFGTMGDDTIRGLAGDDLIDAVGGNNRIVGGSGNNTIYGGSGNDSIFGQGGDNLIFAGGGNNFIRGGSGNNTIHGGEGNDTIFGQGGDDLIRAGGGNNFIRGGNGNNTIHGGDGDDTIRGERGDDLIYAGGGNNRIVGGHGNNTIHGGEGNDTIFGDSGADLLIGGSGNNFLDGGRGNDTIIGGSGNDTIIAGPGRDELWGGGGANTFIFRSGDNNNLIMDFDPESGDILRLRGSLLGQFRNDSAAEIVDRFGVVNNAGNVVLHFDDANTRIILVGFDDLDLLIDHVEII